MSEKFIISDVTGIVVSFEKSVGDHIIPDDVICYVESMKMEIPIISRLTGTIENIYINDGSAIGEGELIASIRVK